MNRLIPFHNRVLHPLECQYFQVLIVLRALGCVNGEVLFADPAPLVFAHLANHMGTAALFFDFNTAVFARADTFRIRLRPLLVAFVYFLLTCLTRVPVIQALETEGLRTFMTASR